jgi:hypothetical protein
MPKEYRRDFFFLVKLNKEVNKHCCVKAILGGLKCKMRVREPFTDNITSCR